MSEFVDTMKQTITGYTDSLIADFLRATSQEERQTVAVAIRQAFVSADQSFDAVVKDAGMYAARCSKLIDVLHHAVAALRTTGQDSIADAVQTMGHKVAEYVPAESSR